MSDIIVELLQPTIEVDIGTTETINVEFPTQGLPGVGVPDGGTTGQVLAKESDDDYDTGWVDPSGGTLPDTPNRLVNTDDNGDIEADRWHSLIEEISIPIGPNPEDVINIPVSTIGTVDTPNISLGSIAAQNVGGPQLFGFLFTGEEGQVGFTLSNQDTLTNYLLCALDLASGSFDFSVMPKGSQSGENVAFRIHTVGSTSHVTIGGNEDGTVLTIIDASADENETFVLVVDDQGVVTSIDLLALLGFTPEPAISSGTTSQYWRGDKTWQTLNSSSVNLGNVDNTSDVNKPISSATQTALDLKVDKTTLAASGKGFVNHGATAGTVRPSGYASIEWVGSVEPTNAVDGDSWIDTSS